MSKMDDIAKAVLRVAKTIDPNAAIAGGYARDTLLGREPKDVDVYVAYTPIMGGQPAEQLRELCGAIAAPLVAQGHTVRATNERPIRRYEALTLGLGGGRTRNTVPNVVKLTVDDVQVDVIAVRASGLNHVWRTFDVGLCMAGINDPETMEVQTDPAHDKDAADKTLTLRFDLVQEDDRRASALAHAQRLLKKYEGFEVKVVL